MKTSRLKKADGGWAKGDTFVSIENLFGSNHGDNFTGNEETNWLSGQDGDDKLYGRGDWDSLGGGKGDDLLNGGSGADHLSGHEGAGTFVFDEDSLPGATGTLADETDRVWDFSGLGADGVKQASEDGDKLDLSGLTETRSYAELKFLGTGNFSGTGLLADGTTSNPAFKGEVRYSYRGDTTDADTTNDTLHTDVTVDLDGDGAADFQVTLEGAHYTLTGADLILA